MNKPDRCGDDQGTQRDDHLHGKVTSKLPLGPSPRAPLESCGEIGDVLDIRVADDRVEGLGSEHIAVTLAIRRERWGLAGANVEHRRTSGTRPMKRDSTARRSARCGARSSR